MRKIRIVLGVAALLSLLLGGVGCGSSRTSDDKRETSLRGEPETKELTQAMDDAVAARDQGKDKVIAALQRVVVADRKLEGLKLTEAEKAALDEKYGARKEELRKKIEE